MTFTVIRYRGVRLLEGACGWQWRVEYDLGLDSNIIPVLVLSMANAVCFSE